MVSGQESVVDPTTFVSLFGENHEENYDPQEGMYFDSQWKNRMKMYIQLTNYSYCQTSEDAHEYIMGLKQCLLDELTQSEDGSGVTTSGIDYDENLYMKMKTFWDLFNAGQFTTTVTCTTCGTVSRTDEPFSILCQWRTSDMHWKSGSYS